MRWVHAPTLPVAGVVPPPPPPPLLPVTTTAPAARTNRFFTLTPSLAMLETITPTRLSEAETASCTVLPQGPCLPVTRPSWRPASCSPRLGQVTAAGWPLVRSTGRASRGAWRGGSICGTGKGLRTLGSSWSCAAETQTLSARGAALATGASSSYGLSAYSLSLSLSLLSLYMCLQLLTNYPSSIYRFQLTNYPSSKPLPKQGVPKGL